MIPAKIFGSNVRMRGNGENVQDVDAFRNRHCCVTAWKFTREELDEIGRTGTVYISVLAKGGMPPIYAASEGVMREFLTDFGTTFPKQPPGAETNPLQGKDWPDDNPPPEWFGTDENGNIELYKRKD